MTTYPQAQSTETLPASFALSDPLVVSPAVAVSVYEGYTGLGNDNTLAAGTLTKVDNRVRTVVEWNGKENSQASAGFDFFDDFHVLPRAFDFGNLLSSQSTPIEVFSAFRSGLHEWTSFLNNAGAGVSLGSSPSLPTNVDPLTSVSMTLDVDANGDPLADGTIDFGFSGVGTIYVRVEIQRIVLWSLTPEGNFSEDLAFLTDVFEAKGGSEKRSSLRKNPRQSWAYDFILEEGEEAQTFENLLFDFQSLTFGVPVHSEDSTTTTTTAVGATTVDVDGTAWRDYRVGGLAAIITSQSVNDVLEISAVNSTSIEFASPTLNEYPIGSKVFPLATCKAPSKIGGSRYPVGLQKAAIRFESVNNDVDLADLSPFSSYNSKLLLDLGNSMIKGNVAHSFEQQITRLDGGAGGVFQDSDWDRHKRTHALTLRASGRQAVWELRGLAHALRGRQVSFYIPRDSDDLVVVSDLLNASNTIDVSSVGYSQFVANRAAKNIIRISFVDGSTPILRTITGSSASSATVDQLVVDSNWTATITPAEISRVEYVEEVRFDTDRIRIEYTNGGRTARLVSTLRSLF